MAKLPTDQPKILDAEFWRAESKNMASIFVKDLLSSTPEKLSKIKKSSTDSDLPNFVAFFEKPSIGNIGTVLKNMLIQNLKNMSSFFVLKILQSVRSELKNMKIFQLVILEKRLELSKKRDWNWLLQLEIYKKMYLVQFRKWSKMGRNLVFWKNFTFEKVV